MAVSGLWCEPAGIGGLVRPDMLGVAGELALVANMGESWKGRLEQHWDVGPKDRDAVS